MRFHLWLINFFGRVVPRRLRSDWRQEWLAELRYRESLLANWDNLNWKMRIDLIRRSLGAFWDALLLQPRRLEDEFFQDLKYGAQVLLKNPGFTLIVIVTLTIGIGANTAAFSSVDGLIFKPLPVKDPDRLVFVTRIASNNRTRNELPTVAFEQFRASNNSLSGIAAYQNAPVSVTSNGQPELREGIFVSISYFDVLGIRPSLGRTFVDDDDKPESPSVGLISNSFWQERFGGSTEVIGQTIHIAKRPVVVIGIIPPEFRGLRIGGKSPDLFLPMTMRNRAALKDPENFAIGRPPDLQHVVARLKPLVSTAQTRDELDAIYQRLLATGAEQPGVHPERIGLRPAFRGDEELPADASSQLRILALVAITILLIASINVSGLLLTRATVRRREIAIRLALGATRLRLVRQLLTESMLLSLLAGGISLIIARFTTSAIGIVLLQGTNIPRFSFSLDRRVLTFTAFVSVITCLLSGIVPALVATRTDINQALKGGKNDQINFPGLKKIGNTFVVLQLSLSIALLIGAGLMTRSLSRLYNVDTGFQRNKVLTVTAYPSLIGYNRDRELEVDDEILRRIVSLPGVESASSALSQIYRGASFVGPRYFETEGIELLTGREFSIDDMRSPYRIAVISESLARRSFPNENPVGQYFSFELGGGFDIKPKTGDIQIVGVVNDIRPNLWDSEWLGSFYLPLHQAPPKALGQIQFLVRTTVDFEGLVPSITEAMRSVEPELPPSSIKSQAEEMNEHFLGGARALTTLLSFFGGLALFLSAVGLYGTLSFAVGRRTKEIGIRIALGAQSRDVLCAVLKETLVLALIGIAIGVPIALAASRLIESTLFGVRPTDPLTLFVVVILMLITALLSGYLPARRATKVDPMVALRSE
jgi:predicted permease